jgi:2-dehydro-3-deoxyglucarate aldolase/4-hydroxy-2-oxoheptanedioate aldolase
MLMNNSIKDRLIGGKPLIGTIITIPSTEIAEIFCQAGFDWLFIDLEHSVLSIKDAQTLMQAAHPSIPCLIRVPSTDETWIKRSLDTGAAGIIVPQIHSVEDVRQVVQFCKYPPEGLRSVGIGRAQGYGEKFQEYVNTSNENLSVVIQIEHIDAVKNIEEIIKVPGIDCLFIGPYDLSASMGKVGKLTDPDVLEAIAKVENAASQAGIPLGIFGSTPESITPNIQNGYTLIAIGIDTMLAFSAAKHIVNSFK